MIDQSLLSILVCPICGNGVKYQKKSDELECQACKIAYPIKDGIPIMLPEKTRVLSKKE
tara:strand:- start:3329 stop:3505 length:177 start_codon:yes stop_codon:yes gene_type:complete